MYPSVVGATSAPTSALSTATLDVVVSAYNAAGTIGATLASLAGQTCRSFGVIVYDDGSSDSTRSVVASWSEALPIRVFGAKESRGPAFGRNFAVTRSTADFITFVDADDLLLPDHIELHRQSCTRGNVLTSSQIVEWDPRSASRPFQAPKVSFPAAGKQWPFILTENFIPIATTVPRSAIMDVGGFRDGVMEDWDLWIRLLRQGFRVRQLPSATYLHRVVTGSRGRSQELLGSKKRVLILAAHESRSRTERKAAAMGLRHLDALDHLESSIQLAGSGRQWSARLHAASALRSPRPRTQFAAMRRVFRPLGLRKGAT